MDAIRRHAHWNFAQHRCILHFGEQLRLFTQLHPNWVCQKYRQIAPGLARTINKLISAADPSEVRIVIDLIQILISFLISILLLVKNRHL